MWGRDISGIPGNDTHIKVIPEEDHQCILKERK